ncbi:unnamed protein product [Polarella glacialis]|uniref:Uncharacterized protein n=1 Tax=Polarella glacialis TaxID=89957 RepID=A0A813GAF4_POLGL|nr:unnamed protein product [Polarella glacialis]
MQECAVDQWCPLCDAVLDSRGHNSRMCCAGGDRTRRHNGLRNRMFRGAVRAGLHPELERPGLLLPSRPGDINQNEQAQRPADVYLPCFTGGLPAALDFAVTAPQRQETLTQATVTALAAASDYDRKKRSFRGTEEACRNQGVTFLPVVIETTGAWSEDATSVLLLMAKAMAVRSGRAAKEELQELLQSAAVSVRRANARACLRRRGEDVSSIGAALLSAQDVLTT